MAVSVQARRRLGVGLARYSNTSTTENMMYCPMRGLLSCCGQSDLASYIATHVHYATAAMFCFETMFMSYTNVFLRPPATVLLQRLCCYAFCRQNCGTTQCVKLRILYCCIRVKSHHVPMPSCPDIYVDIQSHRFMHMVKLQLMMLLCEQ